MGTRSRLTPQQGEQEAVLAVFIVLRKPVHYHSPDLDLHFHWDPLNGHYHEKGEVSIYSHLCVIEKSFHSYIDTERAIEETVNQFWQNELILRRYEESTEDYKNMIQEDSEYLITLFSDNDGLPPGLRVQVYDCREQLLEDWLRKFK